MKYSFTLAALAALAFGKEMPKDEVRAAELYDSGVMHERIMAEKFKQFDAMANARASQLADPYVELHFAQCRDGKSVPFRDQPTFFFRCNNMNLHHFLPHSMMGSQTGQGSSSWGWTSDDGREFAIIAQADGAAFAEVRIMSAVPESNSPLTISRVLGLTGILFVTGYPWWQASLPGSSASDPRCRRRHLEGDPCLQALHRCWQRVLQPPHSDL